MTTSGPVLDVTGLRCPLPVLKARPFLRAQAPGTIALIRADDPMARVDLPHMCAADGHRLVAEHSENEILVFEIETGRQAPPPPADRTRGQPQGENPHG